jgi:hypothetical protein
LSQLNWLVNGPGKTPGPFFCRMNGSRKSTDFAPDGQITGFPVQPFAQKYSASRFARNSFMDSSVPAHRGAFRDRHKRWAGDAVDADAPLTNGADADGEVVWS